MAKKILNKIILAFIGLCLALILLELSMQAAGLALSSYQKYKNNKILKNKSSYTVMCIGESTTAGAYPEQLREILNTKYPGKFSVIDTGLQATNLQIILELLDNNIDKYKPDIAVCMMGINNNLFIKRKDNYINKTRKNNFKNKIKTYKLYLLLKEHLTSLIGAREIFADEINSGKNLKPQMYNAADLFLKGNFVKAAEAFENILKIDPLNDFSYTYLINIYYCCLTDRQHIAYEMAKKAVDLGLKNRTFYYQIIIEYYISHNRIRQAKGLINTVFNDEHCALDFDFYSAASKIMTKEQKEQTLNRIFSEKSDIYYALMALNSIEMKDFAEADQYFNMAEALRLNFPNEETVKLYRLIIKKLVDNKIKVICMQYPVRSVNCIKNILKDESYYDRITFLSNEAVFKKDLKEKPYDKMFTDRFAGDFGHCTDYGNTLIAENVVQTLEELTETK